MKRTFVQINATHRRNDFVLYTAIASDGTAWYRLVVGKGEPEEFPWFQLPDLPQPTSPTPITSSTSD